MAEILDRIHAEIRERLAAGRAAAQEYERLEAALAALGGPAAAPARTRRRPAQPRAPRGANRVAVLRALEERPGASASELAAASGVDRTALYPLLSRLADRGEVSKEQLPGGATGYRLVREEPTAFPRPEAALPAAEAAPPAPDEPPLAEAA
jgi:MarR family